MAKRRRYAEPRQMLYREIVVVRGAPWIHLATSAGRSTIVSLEYGFAEVREVLSSSCRRAETPIVLPVWTLDVN